jgi:hypothetical protein
LQLSDKEKQTLLDCADTLENELKKMLPKRLKIRLFAGIYINYVKIMTQLWLI